MELTALLAELVEANGSDLHLVTGQPPIFRVGGELIRREGETLSETDIERMLLPNLSEGQKAALAAGAQDAGVTLLQDEATFRVHVFRERGAPAAAIRMIPSQVPTLDMIFSEENTVKTILQDLIRQPRGLILLTGPTGCGKTTTCFSLLEEINRTRAERIVTVEESISYVLQSKQSLITQRSVGQDVASFEDGARSAWQEDLDVIFLGALATLDTLRLALALAETGHLVISQLDVESAPDAVQRLIEAFPEPRENVRRMLARHLLAVVAQKLLPRSGRTGRVPANEILLATPRVKQMIADGQGDLNLAIEASRDQGMQTMDDSVLALYGAGAISEETARYNLEDPTRLGTPPPKP